MVALRVDGARASSGHVIAVNGFQEGKRIFLLEYAKTPGYDLHAVLAIIRQNTFRLLITPSLRQLSVVLTIKMST